MMSIVDLTQVFQEHRAAVDALGTDLAEAGGEEFSDAFRADLLQNLEDVNLRRT